MEFENFILNTWVGYREEVKLKRVQISLPRCSK